MIGRHSLLELTFSYLPARLLPGLINLLALGLYTRILDPAAYGRYALVIVVVNLAQALIFRWLRLALLRRYSGEESGDDLGRLISTVWGSYVASGAITATVWSLVVVFAPLPPTLETSFGFGLLLLLSQAAFEITLTLQMASLRPSRYMLYALTRSLVALGAAYVLIVSFRLQEEGVILGMSLGTLLPVIMDLPSWRNFMSIRLVDRMRARDLLSYGFPLTIALAMGMLILTSDRFLIGYFLNEASVGHFSVASDFAQQGLTLLFSVVNLAAYPLAVQALERGGRSEADFQLEENIILMLLPTLPTTLGIVMLAGPLTNLLFGAPFFRDVSGVLPWITTATLLTGIRSFYFDTAFQLGNRTAQQILPVGITVLVNVFLNILWIPQYGVLGAAYATVAAQAGGMVASALIGRGYFQLPLPWSDLVGIALSSALMGIFLWAWPEGQGWGDLIVEGLIGLGIYGLGLLAFNPGGLRLRMVQALER